MAGGRTAPKAVAIKTLKKPGYYRDRGDGAVRGLYLQIVLSKRGTLCKSWTFRYVSPASGKARWMGLGSVADLGLADARTMAGEARRVKALGRDPIDERNKERVARKLEAARAVSFKQAAERYIAAHEKSWKNAKHKAQWSSTLEAYAYPVLGSLPVAAIDEGHVLKILEPIWSAKPETASRVRQRIENVLDWATARKYRKGDNPARWRGHLDKLLPKASKVRRVRNHPALPYTDMPEFAVELRSRDGISARALEFTILTACRTGEVINATWGEINFADKVWAIPAERMKAGKSHKVPLSDRALEILGTLPREKDNPHVFVGTRQGAALSNMAMLELMKHLRSSYVPHGFRSTFRDWAAEQTTYPNHVVEKALAHTVADKVEAAYRRGDLFEHRRRLMNKWAEYCSQKPVKSGTVVALASA